MELTFHIQKRELQMLIKIEEIGKQKNPNFVIDSHERSDLDEINIVNTINILDDKNLPLNANVPSMHILGDIIPKIKKLLNGTNYRFHSPNQTSLSKEELEKFAINFSRI